MNKVVLAFGLFGCAALAQDETARLQQVVKETSAIIKGAERPDEIPFHLGPRLEAGQSAKLTGCSRKQYGERLSVPRSGQAGTSLHCVSLCETFMLRDPELSP